MAACCSAFECAADQQFNEKKATEELKRFRTKGPRPTTRLLQQGLEHAGALSGTLLDIGSGIGSLTFGLLEQGITHAVAVDASSAYNGVARQEAAPRPRRRGAFRQCRLCVRSARAACGNRWSRSTASCCYPSYEALLNAALDHAEQCLGLSLPRDVWYVRLGVMLENAPSSEEEPIPHLRPSGGPDGRTDSVCGVRAVHAEGDVDVVGRRTRTGAVQWNAAD